MGDQATEPERVVQRQVDFYNAKDIEGFLSTYARDPVVGRFPEGKVVAQGRNEMRKAYAPLFQANPLLNCRIVQRIVTGVLFSALLPTFARASEDRVVLPLATLPDKIAVDDMRQQSEGLIADSVVDALFEMGEGFQISPVLAESVSWEDGGRTFDVRLKPESFSDGSAVTADDVLMTLRRCIKQSGHDELSPLRSIVGYADFVAGKTADLKGLTKVSGRELRIGMTRPTPLLPDALTCDACVVTKGRNTDLLSGAVGTGPYEVQSTDAKEIVLRKRSNYLHPRPGPAVIEYRATKDLDDFSKLKDWATMIVMKKDPGDAPGFRKYEYSPLGSYLLVLNNSKAPFDDERIREAVALALDFSVLAKEMGWREERLQAGLFPFGMRGFKARRATRDLDRAVAILRRAGYTDRKPLHFTIAISRVIASPSETAAWSKAFSGAPIAASVELLSPGALVSKKRSGDFVAMREVTGPGSLDGYKTLIQYLSRSKNNTPRASAPGCDAITMKAISTPGVDARNALYGQAEDCLMAHHVVVPLASLETRYALIRSPWDFTRTSRYNLQPYSVPLWRRDAD